MLKSLRLENFRCFKDHVVPLRPTTIIVGRNNAGKSTIVEALRLVSLTISRAPYLNPSDVPKWLDAPKSYRGVSPSLRGFEFDFTTAFHRYGEPPAIITAEFSAGGSIRIFIGKDKGGESQIHAVVESERGFIASTKGQVQSLNMPSVVSLPQIGPLLKEEKLLVPDYVRNAVWSSLAPLHFRNQLLVFPSHFQEFKRIAESTWDGLRIKELTKNGRAPDTTLSLLVRDGDFVAEVSWMGHGLQMWLQTMWFLARSKGSATVIFDEPDVYMHPDLQRRLIRVVKSRNPQVIVATHSIEIMAEVDPEEILVIDQGRREAKFADSLPAVQRVIDQIGGVHNLNLARLSTSKKCLLVEGKDIEILKQLQNTLAPNSSEPVDAIPNMPIGGWGGWSYAVGSRMFLTNALGEDILTYCLLDSDYHTAEAISGRYEEAKRVGVCLHIWRRKEIENYLLVPSAILRAILSNSRKKGEITTEGEVRSELKKIAGAQKDAAFDAISQEVLSENRSQGTKFANEIARRRIDEAWCSTEGRISAVSGKLLLSRLSEWSQNRFGVSLSARRLARELRGCEIDTEASEVILAIEEERKITLTHPGIASGKHTADIRPRPLNSSFLKSGEALDTTRMNLSRGHQSTPLPGFENR
jgi:energy-coupling factor transporter ATP-binding protein EcfA2